MKVAAYLARIGLDARPPATLEGLSVLQDHHMRHVAFENLDVVMGRPLSLSVEDLFEKIVGRGRGGYCFELNTLYAELLRAVGFDPVPVMARVWLRDPPETPPQTHLAHLVDIAGTRWLTDVGFGGRASRRPLPLPKAGDDPTPVDDGDGCIRVVPDARWGYRVQRELDNAWAPQYSFTDAPAPASDIACGNHWVETHPTSHFRHGLSVGLFTETGRTGLYGGTLTVRTAGGANSSPVVGVEDTLAVLRSTFALHIAPTTGELARLAAIVAPAPTP